MIAALSEQDTKIIVRALRGAAMMARDGLIKNTTPPAAAAFADEALGIANRIEGSNSRRFEGDFGQHRIVVASLRACSMFFEEMAKTAIVGRADKTRFATDCRELALRLAALVPVDSQPANDTVST